MERTFKYSKSERRGLKLLNDEMKNILSIGISTGGSAEIKMAKKCIRIVYQNIYFAIGIKVLCLILGAVGIANMWIAIFADVGVMVIAVLNAIRALFGKKL